MKNVLLMKSVDNEAEYQDTHFFPFNHSPFLIWMLYLHFKLIPPMIIPLYPPPSIQANRNLLHSIPFLFLCGPFYATAPHSELPPIQLVLLFSIINYITRGHIHKHNTKANFTRFLDYYISMNYY